MNLSSLLRCKYKERDWACCSAGQYTSCKGYCYVLYFYFLFSFSHLKIIIKAVADIIRTTLGPRSMLKMLLDPMGGIVMTNDGNCILREVDVSHPAAKSMIELSRAQDEEVGDGTTSVIILSKSYASC